MYCRYAQEHKIKWYVHCCLVERKKERTESIVFVYRHQLINGHQLFINSLSTLYHFINGQTDIQA